MQKVRDPRWTTKDKLNQYRGILKLYARENRRKSQDAVKAKNRVSYQLSVLKTDVKNYREILTRIASGNVARTLRHRKDLLVKYQRRDIETIYAAIYHENQLKRRQLDKLQYNKKKKLERCFQLQLTEAKLSERYREEQQAPGSSEQHPLITRYQESTAKHNAAKAIRSTYLSMLQILNKDAVYQDSLVNLLKEDQKHQCELMLKATVIGQLAAENFDDICQKYKRMARDVWKNMKTRERTLNAAREQVEDLWAYAQSLIRTDSEPALAKKELLARTTSHALLEGQINTFEQIFDRVNESLLVRYSFELFSRLEEQTRQRTRLLTQFHLSIKEHDVFQTKKNEALESLTNIEHSMVAINEKYEADKRNLFEQIELQRKRKSDRERLREEHGQLLMDIRATLQNMLAMLVCVRKVSKSAKRKVEDKKVKEKADGEEGEKEESPIIPVSSIIETVDTEGLALLSTVSKKVGMLFGMSNFELDAERENKAKDLYQTYVSDYRSNLVFHDADVEPAGLFVEHEAVDGSVPTRAEIKLRSKQLIEMHLKLLG